MDDLPFDYPSPATPTGARPKPHRHRWVPYPVPRTPIMAILPSEPGPTEWCDSCHRWRDPVTSRNGRNNRARGGRAELDVARQLGGRKVGILGHPWDVEVPGYARFQVKKLAHWPSLAAVCQMLDAIPRSGEMRGAVLVQAAGQGRHGRALVVLELDEYAERHGGG